MNRREKILSGAIGGLVVIIIAYFVWSAVNKSTTERHNRLAVLRQDVQRQDRTLELASRATRKLAKLQAMSLPGNQEQANSVYSEWLLELVDRVGFRDPSVRASDRRYRTDHFDRLRFDIQAESSLDELTHFLADFYGASDLHKIESLTVKPIRDSRLLDLTIAVEAISLPGSVRTTVGDVASTEISNEMIEAARQAIQNRAIFFPLNIAPQLESISNQQLVRGRSWRFEVQATDPDPWDSVEFSTKSELPSGMRFSPRDDRAVFTWTPANLGEHSIQLAVRDTGNPSRETVREFKVTVVEPSEREAESNGADSRVTGFDHASQTYLVGAVGSGNKQQAWFDIRTQGKILKLSVGDVLQVGSIEGKVTEIGQRHVQLGTETGSLRIAIGDRLTDARPEVARK